MKPQTKRSFCLGAFLVIVTLVVLYSYCNGSSVCYTFPLFNGLERDSLQAKPPAEMVVTSVIVQTKQPFDMGTIQKNQGRVVVNIYHHVGSITSRCSGKELALFSGNVDWTHESGGNRA